MCISYKDGAGRIQRPTMVPNRSFRRARAHLWLIAHIYRPRNPGKFMYTKYRAIVLSLIQLPAARTILNRAYPTPAGKGVESRTPYSNEEIYRRIQKAGLEHRLAPGTKLIEE